MRPSQFLLSILATISSALPIKACADELLIAVSSNFYPTLSEIVSHYHQQSSHRIKLSSGSTGKHYAQILHGAPFDAFFSADMEHVQKLKQQLKQKQSIDDNCCFIYARGRLALWGPEFSNLYEQGADVLSEKFSFIAFANPDLAPYGRATEQVLQYLNRFDEIETRVVQGENITQAYQFVASGAAQLGFVAYSQLLTNPNFIDERNFWLIPESFHAPIKQQAMMLNNKTALVDFMAFVKTRAMGKIISDNGYAAPVKRPMTVKNNN